MNECDDMERLDYTGPAMMRKGDLVVVRGFDPPLPYDGRTNGRGVAVRLGTGPKPAWIDDRNIEAILRAPAPLPDRPGLYRGAKHTVFMLDREGAWHRLTYASLLIEDDLCWGTRPRVVPVECVRRAAPLTRIDVWDE
ncbi:hypothetical protein [Bifidobacterium callitrichidarum]|uniref:Uncharacterized protein n=1 Tax=Bifidobacterium callitrichidarum TaxID=2052941 RepID=A0A2U2N943_9BIFI|nr:hypothetical protein [Bifidobacterium callitrichidarum]PWG65610.1 hypothetical protein DF196_06665 [Bifidobacterium callitrichidarum]